MKQILTRSALVLALGAFISTPFLSGSAEAESKTLTGEVVDLMCYVPNGAKGDGHKGCAEKCIKSGGPVGLLVDDQIYLVVGDHEPANALLASKAAQKITVTGKVSERSGIKMISNIKITKEG